MTDRPIIFSTPMIKALLVGSKTQTRRVLKPQPPGTARYTGVHYASDEPDTWFFNSPQGPAKVRQAFDEGDRLWVRETWQIHSRASDLCSVVYKASINESWTEAHEQFPDTLAQGMQPKPFQAGWASPIHMPRWASRLTLTVTSVKVERLQDLSEEDALAEGVDHFAESLDRPGSWEGLSHTDRIGMTQVLYGSARRGYQHLWEMLHGPNAWAANLWVAAVSFTCEQRNIDAGGDREMVQAGDGGAHG